MIWQWKKIEDLSGKEMHDILAVRQQVFVVEQNCIYLDADELDRQSWHLTGISENGDVEIYARLNFPGSRFAEPSIGRVLTCTTVRKQGYAKMAVIQAIEKSRREYPGQNIRISAQIYLTRFYSDLGFRLIGEPYDEDGIEHIDMILEEKI